MRRLVFLALLSVFLAVPVRAEGPLKMQCWPSDGPATLNSNNPSTANGWDISGYATYTVDVNFVAGTYVVDAQSSLPGMAFSSRGQHTEGQGNTEESLPGPLGFFKFVMSSCSGCPGACTCQAKVRICGLP